jgi:von Willebrand factor A domain-containing protein 7
VFSRKQIRQSAGLCLAVAGLVLSVPPAAQAFCPNNGVRCGFGLVGTTHKDMTKQAIEELDQEFFSTSRLTKSMKKAIEEIWEANAQVDEDEPGLTASHFDGENFDGGKARLARLLDGAVSALRNEDAQGARKMVGAALHSLQDFYSHSNFVEAGNSGAFPSLWNGSPVSYVSRETPTCKPCELIIIPELPPIIDCTSNLLTNALTSGYYGGQDVTPAVSTKCRHGGLLDTGTGPDGGINKDTLLQTFSPHNFAHGSAAASALQATKAFIREIKSRVTERQIKLLLGVGPTLAMSIDTTGSMGSIIAQVRSQAIQIVDSRIGTDQEPLKYVLAPFNDPSTGPLTVTDDPAVFKSAISSLFASGGGDCPELSMTGALQALGGVDRGADLFTFTDADALDAGLGGNVSSLAQNKDAKVYPLLFGSCGGFATASLADGTGTETAAVTALPFDPVYARIANDTGGQYFFLGFSEAGQITRVADAVVRANAVDLLSVADTLAGGAKVYTLPVDSTLERVTFSLSGSTSLTLTRPDGSVVQPTDAGVQVIALSSGRVVTVLQPAPGSWTAMVSGSADFSFNVLGESPFDFDRFAFVEIAGRPGHQGYFDLEGFPVVGQQTVAAAELSAGVTTAAFDLRDKTGAPLGSLNLTLEAGGSGAEFFGEVQLPNRPFLVYATGAFSNGEAFQRVISKTVQPQTVRVFAPVARSLTPGQTTLYNFEVTNYGPANTFRFTALDDLGFVTGVTPAIFSLATGESAQVTVELAVPSGTPEGGTDVLTASVESLAPEGARNFAVLESPVMTSTSAPTLNCAQARSNVSSLWPPDHRLVPVTVQGITSSDGSPVTVRFDEILQSEPTEGLGDGDTCPDGEGIGTATAQIRSERSGDGSGRVYTLRFTARTDSGGSCQGSVNLCVQHSRVHDCAAVPVTFDSTSCP